MLWRCGFIVVVGAFLWILHRFIGSYPAVLPKSEQRSKNIMAALLLGGMAILFPLLMMDWGSPWLDRMFLDWVPNLVAQAIFGTMIYLLLPVLLVTRFFRWAAPDFGLSIKNRSSDVTIFAVAFGVGSGCIAYFTGQSNISIQTLPLEELLLLIYSNAFLEEFFHRGTIQSLLERAVGQANAIVWGGVLFGLTHVGLDVAALGVTGSTVVVISALMLQTIAGWMFGIIYMKTRSLWPGTACHYLANWLPSILVLAVG